MTTSTTTTRFRTKLLFVHLCCLLPTALLLIRLWDEATLVHAVSASEHRHCADHPGNQIIGGPRNYSKPAEQVKAPPWQANFHSRLKASHRHRPSTRNQNNFHIHRQSKRKQITLTSNDSQKAALFEHQPQQLNPNQITQSGQPKLKPGRRLKRKSRLQTAYLAHSRGFHLQTHTVTTKDSYVLTLHRLINPNYSFWADAGSNSSSPSRPKGVVIIQHGILCASSFFLINSSPQFDRPTLDSTSKTNYSNSLPIELSNRGYDVWLTNFRGNEYSRSHLAFDPNLNSRFWDFNVDHLILYDFEAYVNYVLQVTKAEKYTFIGHSLGATVGLGALLVHSGKQVTEKLECSIFMAPVASTQFMKGSLLPTFELATMLYDDLAPFPGRSGPFKSFIKNLCPLISRACRWLVSMFVGPRHNGKSAGLAGANSIRDEDESFDEDGDDDDEVELDDEPFGEQQIDLFEMMMNQAVSIQLLKHIIQVHSSGRLSRYNYGNNQNLGHYPNSSPFHSGLAPIYNLDEIRIPHLKMAIVSGVSDAISTPEEVEWISEQINDESGHVKLLEQIVIPENPFNHMDLVLSKDTGRLVNSRLIQFIEKNDCA